MFRTAALTLVALLLAAAAPAAPADDAKTTLKSWEGDWKILKIVHAGAAVDADAIKSMRFTFKGDQLIPSDNPKDVATLKLDPSAKVPTVDMTDTHNETSLGIYERAGDTLRLCFAEPKAARPTAFASTAANKAVLIELKKIEK